MVREACHGTGTRKLGAFFRGRIAESWTPDELAFVDTIPLGTNGRMQRNKLHEQLKDDRLPNA